jgi:hypothetical protein
MNQNEGLFDIAVQKAYFWLIHMPAYIAELQGDSDIACPEECPK